MCELKIKTYPQIISTEFKTNSFVCRFVRLIMLCLNVVNLLLSFEDSSRNSTFSLVVITYHSSLIDQSSIIRYILNWTCLHRTHLHRTQVLHIGHFSILSNWATQFFDKTFENFSFVFVLELTPLDKSHSTFRTNRLTQT